MKAPETAIRPPKHAPMHGRQVSPEEAKRLIDEHAAGYVVIPQIEPKPVLGHVAPGEHEADVSIDTYHFGDPEDAVVDRP